MSFDRANDVGYIATIQAGTPPREFSILMDSGSADFWIGAEGCKAKEGGDCVRAIRLIPSICSDIASPLRVTTSFSAHNLQPASKTPETPSRLHMALARCRETSSLIMSTSLVWLWINTSLALLLWNLWISPVTPPSSMV